MGEGRGCVLGRVINTVEGEDGAVGGSIKNKIKRHSYSDVCKSLGSGI